MHPANDTSVLPSRLLHCNTLHWWVGDCCHL